MSHSRFDAVCFDMDGVLVDSESYWARREREEIFPASVTGDVNPEDVAGMNVADLYDHLEREYGTCVPKAAFIARYDDAARTLYREEVTLLSGAHELIRDLRRDQAVALVSSSPVRWISHVLDRFDLSFDTIVSADHVNRGKPAPDVYERAAADLDVSPGDCVAVEDSAHGVDAARAAGLGTVGFSRHGDPPDADRIASDVGDLRAALSSSDSPRP